MNQSTKTFALFLTSILLVVTMQFLSCKKNSNSNPTPTPVNYLCQGNGETSYYPLKIGDKWEYSGTGSLNFSNEVTGTKLMGGKTYFKVHYIDQVSNFDDYYRKDSLGNGIYKYSYADLIEYLYIPANPTSGQVIATYISGASRKVTGINMSLTTSSCSYTGLVKIEDLFADGTTEKTMYYKKGLGLVQTTTFFPSSLNAVTFK